MNELDNNNMDITPSDWVPANSIIKVIGVGGGGCNAVNYMYNKRIEGCTFIVCNTDSQALENCDVPVKIQLGEGLGAGCNPTEGRNAALNSQEEIAEKVINGLSHLPLKLGAYIYSNFVKLRFMISNLSFCKPVRQTIHPQSINSFIHRLKT